MKFAILALQSTTLAASVAAQDAFLFAYDQGVVRHAPDASIRVTSDTASSVIARRRGVTDDRYVSTTSETDLLKTNFYGGYQRPLFGAGQTSAPEKLLVRISGYESRILQFAQSIAIPDFWVETPSRDLLDDFKARKEVESVCEYNLSTSAKQGIDIVYSYYPEGAPCKTTSEVEKLPSLVDVYSHLPNVKDIDTHLAQFLYKMNKLSAINNVESTILILPPEPALHNPKRRRFAQAEEPLDLPIPTTAGTSSNHVTVQQANSSHPLPKIVPLCFTSESACKNVTNSCSGHGECYRAHANCYKCECGTTSTTSKLGKKTTQWGGNACQKKDVSVPFALFATFGIVMTALVAGVIGMLYSMGAQDLPSVLGAGVGSKSQK